MTLKIDGVSAGYGRLQVLRDVNLELARGTIVAVVGANGAGKSTLVKTVSGLLRATTGSITVDDRPVHKLSPERRARLGIVHVPEGRKLFASLTVAENLAMGRQAARGRTDGSPQVVDRLLDSFPILRDRWNQHAGLLSGGEQQMVALTRAAAAQPRYLLLDEPSLGLSPRLSEEVFHLVSMIAEETGAGVLLVEQRVDAALRLADTAHVLEHGRFVTSGPAETVRTSEAVRVAYLGV